MDDVLSEKRRATLWLTINRPEQRNALNNEVLTALTGALRDAKGDRELRAIVLTGAGDKAFCAGGDLKGAAAKDHNTFQAPQGNAAVPRGELDAKIDTLIATLVERSPTAIRLGKHALHAVQDMTLPQCLDYMTLMLDRLAATEDAREGFAAFADKRKPVWTGR